MLSIICAYNNEKILKERLEKSLKAQNNVNYEYIPINAKKHGFESASETLNYAGKIAKGKYIIFVHQDVVFEKNNVLEKIYKYCCNCEFGIAGVAGCFEDNGKIVTLSNIHHGKNHKEVSVYKLEKIEEVAGLDECLLIIPKNIFEKYSFNYYGKTWHLYGTDYSIKMKENGYNVVVFPIDIWHLSDGASLNENYFDTIKKIAQNYKKEEKIITLFGIWPTNKMILTLKCIYRKIRLLIKGK